MLTRVLVQHVSATLRKSSINNGTEADQSKKQVVLFTPQENAAATTNNKPNDPRLSVGGPTELSGLSIINQGQLTLHYHSYGPAQSSSYQSATESRKHALEKEEDEEYSEALASLMDCNLSAPNRPKTFGTSKRRRMEKSGAVTPHAEPATAEGVAGLTQAEAEEQQDEAEQQSQVKQGGNQPLIQKTNNTKLCKKCGNIFNPEKNKGPKKRCGYHPGM